VTKKQRATALFANVFAQAAVAGKLAANAAVPPVMVVRSNSGQQWEVPDGPCGFAWVTVRPANSAAGHFAATLPGWKPAYGGGISFWVGDYNQSMVRKEAYAHAFAATLNAHGIVATSDSRMD
jgi:hypothetical protein